MSFLEKVRKPEGLPIWKTALFCVMFVILGAAAGAFSKLADVYSEILGNFTSGMCIWIFLGTLICARTKSPFRAAAYVLLFCAGMIAAYYLTAELGELYYSRSYVRGWSVFTLFTPIFAVVAWYAKGSGALSWVIRLGIIAVMLCSVFLCSGHIVLDPLVTAAAFAVTINTKERK